MRYAVLTLLLLAVPARADLTFEAVPLAGVKADLAQLKQIELARYNGTLPSAYWWPWGLKAADLDKDGKPDLYVNFHSGVGGLLFWNKTPAGGPLQFQRDTQFDDAAGWGNRKLPRENLPFVADLDGDGWLDLVSAGDEVGAFVPNLRNVAGVLTQKGKGPNYSYGTVRDLNADGLPDITRATRGYGKTVDRTKLLKPDWTWTASTNTPILAPPGIPVAITAKLAALAADPTSANRYGGPVYRPADLNGDGRPDLIVQYANAYTNNPAYRWVAYCLRNEAGDLVETNLGIVGLDLQVGDYNGDGRTDIFTSQVTGAGLFLQQPDGGFKNVSPPNAARTSISDFVRGVDSYGYGIRAVDLDKDGDLDLYVHGMRSRGGRVYQCDGATYRQILAFRHWDAEGADLADVNGDGLLDIVSGGQPTDDDVTVYLNRSVPPAPPAVTLGPLQPALAGKEVAFAAAVQSGVPGPIAYAWDFGDGGIGQGKTPSHTYAAAGEYAVTVTVTDPLGQTGTATLTVTVTDPGPARGSRLPLPSEDQATPAFARLKGMADGGRAKQTVLAYLYRTTGGRPYGDAAVASLTAYLDAADAAIAAGAAPRIARDQYLYVGDELSALAAVYDWCHDLLDAPSKARVEAFAEQTLANLWTPKSAAWGGTPFPWAGWGTNKPARNYHHSFMRATVAWALVSQNKTWLDLLANEKWPAVAAALAPFPEGGSDEGTGYGPAVRYLLEAMRWWKDSGRPLPPELTAHARGWIDYWVHATTPDFSRFAPLGNQARDSQAKQYDYHRQVMLEAVRLAPESPEAARGRWWLSRVYSPMTHDFSAFYDLLADAGPASPPSVTHYAAPGVGHYFWRSGWDKNAAFLTLAAGPMRADHDHGDKGSFSLWRKGWLSVTGNIHSISGIKNMPELTNCVRFERDGKSLPQKFSLNPTYLRRMLADTHLHFATDLSPIYATPGLHWCRVARLEGLTLTIDDGCLCPAGVVPVWQMQFNEEPVIEGTSITVAGMRVTLNDGVTITKEDLRTSSLDKPGTFLGGWRVSARGTDGFSATLVME